MGKHNQSTMNWGNTGEGCYLIIKCIFQVAKPFEEFDLSKSSVLA